MGQMRLSDQEQKSNQQDSAYLCSSVSSETRTRAQFDSHRKQLKQNSFNLGLTVDLPVKPVDLQELCMFPYK